MVSPTLKDAVANGTSPSAIYVYAFLDATRTSDLQRSFDADEQQSLHRVGAISVLISFVRTADFEGAEGERDLADPAWLMPRIRRHEAVVESAMKWSPVFPLRFATLFISLDSLTHFVRRHVAAIESFLWQVTDQQEWALKVTAKLDDLVALDDLAAELWPGWSDYSPGRRYLRLRQERPGLLKVARERAARLMPGIANGLHPIATSVRPFIRSASSDDPGDHYTESYVFLTSVGQRQALHQRLNELVVEWEHRSFQMGLSGPWPPYSFRPVLDESFPWPTR
jgi:hypothetical protein